MQITVYDSDNHPGNHFELKFSYNAVSPSPIIALSQKQRIPSIAGIEWTGLAGTSNNKIAKNRYREYYFYQQYRTSLSTLFWVYTLERHPGEAKELGLVGPALLANFS